MNQNPSRKWTLCHYNGSILWTNYLLDQFYWHNIIGLIIIQWIHLLEKSIWLDSIWSWKKHFDGFDGHPRRMVAPNGCGDADRTVSNGAGHPGESSFRKQPNISAPITFVAIFRVCWNTFLGVSENSVPLNPMVLLIIIPFLNGYFIGNINPTFSDKPFSSFFKKNWGKSWNYTGHLYQLVPVSE